MKQLILFLGFLSFYNVQAQFRCQDIKQEMSRAMAAVPSINNNAKSDTIDILHYDIDLNLCDIAAQQLEGRCTILFTPKVANVNIINLDLLELNIQSVEMSGIPLSYSYNDTIIHIHLGASYGSNDTLSLEIAYNGQPEGDASGWGGFHFQNGYYYNLGVGFAANPHTYGRVWFPCFDNFVEKTTYSFKAITKSPNKAFFNGLRQVQASLGGDTLYTEWNLTDPIPTYLASVAVSNYAEVSQTVNGLNGLIPIRLMAKPNDTAALKTSFQNLKPTFNAFETYLGPYRWQKVGYALTTRGAMEHATSIHYPNSLVTGNLNGEDIMAHELAHHWWGNLVTCETAEDMWINEGMAEFCSHLYLEQVYNRERYLDEVQQNAYNVLNSAHIQDDGYKAIAGLDHEYVYGFHVYQKGAMVAHNLRAYLGDSTFFAGLQVLLNTNAFGNLNTLEFRDQLQQITGVSLLDFFEGWVTNPGYPTFAVDSMDVPAFAQNNIAHVKVAQTVNHAPALFKNVPVEITFFADNGDTVSRQLLVNGITSEATFQDLPFKPVFALCGYSGKLLSGDTYDDWTFDQTRFYVPRQGNVRFNVKSIQDSARLISMYHWAGPHGKIPSGKDYKISENRFWTFQGFDLQKADFTARITYNGSPGGNDQDLASVTEDSLIVLYREYPWEPWTIYPDQQKTDLGSSTNGLGYFELDNPKPGDYVLANTSEKIGIREEGSEKGQIDIYPNPSEGRVNIRFKQSGGEKREILVSDSAGKTIYRNIVHLTQNSQEVQIDLPDTATSYVTVSIDGLTQRVLLK